MNSKLVPPFFILGSQRSGTTLLRLMLNTHSQIAIPEEGGFWMPLLRDYRKGKTKITEKTRLKQYIDYIENNPQFSLWNLDATTVFTTLKKQPPSDLKDLMDETYMTFARANGKKVWGDKTPSFFRMIPVLNDLFPNAKFIHLVRDGRDVYLSRRSRNPAMRNISVQALEWVYKMKKARRDLNRLDSAQVFELKYEDLVYSPAEKLKELCIFLNVFYEPEMLEYWKESEQFIGTHHSKLIFQPVSSQSVAKWKKNMTRQQLRMYEIIAGPLLIHYGYELSGQMSPTFIDYVTVALDLAVGLPGRSARVLFTALNMRLSANYGFRLFSETVGDMPEDAVNKKTDIQ